MQYWYNYAIWIVLAFTFTNFSSHIFTIQVYTVWMCQVLFYTIHLFYKWEFLKSFLFCKSIVAFHIVLVIFLEHMCLFFIFISESIDLLKLHVIVLAISHFLYSILVLIF